MNPSDTLLCQPHLLQACKACHTHETFSTMLAQCVPMIKLIDKLTTLLKLHNNQLNFLISDTFLFKHYRCQTLLFNPSHLSKKKKSLRKDNTGYTNLSWDVIK
jgi:hypothetical protein